MITIDLPEMPFQKIPLTSRTVRGRGISKRPEADCWVELSKVATMTFTEADIETDADLKLFYASQSAEYRFSYIRIACTFKNSANRAFKKVSLGVALNYPNKVSAPDIWSMDPNKVADSKTIKKDIKIGVKFNLAHVVEAGPEVGFGQESETTEEFITAYLKGPKGPYWEIKETGKSKIDGNFFFHMITRANKNEKVNGKIYVAALLDQTNYFFFHSEKEMVDLPSGYFELLP